MQNTPFNSYNSKKNFDAQDDEIRKLNMLFEKKTQRENSSFVKNLLIIIHEDHHSDLKLLEQLKKPNIMSALLSDWEVLVKLMAAMIKSDHIHKSLVFLTGQVTSLGQDPTFIQHNGDAFAMCSTARQKQLQQILFHEFSFFTKEHFFVSMLLGKSPSLNGAKALAPFLEDPVVWKPIKQPLTPQSLLFLHQNKNLFDFSEKNGQEWEQVMIEGVFSMAHCLDFGQGTSWVQQILGGLDENKRMGSLLKAWKERHKNGNTDALKKLEPFLTDEEISAIAMEVISTHVPSLKNRMTALTEKGLIKQQLQNGQKSGRKM